MIMTRREPCDLCKLPTRSSITYIVLIVLYGMVAHKLDSLNYEIAWLLYRWYYISGAIEISSLCVNSILQHYKEYVMKDLSFPVILSPLTQIDL